MARVTSAVPPAPPASLPPDRFDRQRRFAPIGAQGQERLAAAHVAILGVGALGSACAESLVRAGVGRLRLIDRDLVEWSNLHRQGLYTAADAQAGLPKAVAAQARLQAIDPSVRIEAIVTEARAASLPGLIAGVDLVLDGTDTFATRHLLNEACMRACLPWIYGACVGAYGCSMPIVRGRTPCLRCLQDVLPAPGDSPTCDTVGIIPPAVQLVAAWQVAEALKLLVGDLDHLRTELWSCDLWANTTGRLRLAAWRDPACPACSPTASFPLLAQPDAAAVVLCGRDAIQVLRPAPDLERLAQVVAAHLVVRNPYLLRWQDGPLTLTCFRDGRVLVQGVHDPAQARAACDRWLG